MKQLERKPIGEEEIARAAALLEKYRDAKAAYDERIVTDEEWWKMRASGGGDSTAWLFNAVANKHADAMDNFPSPVILPREEGDADDAEKLSDIVPVILSQCDFERTYSDVWYDKLKHGTGCYGVFWNPARCRGRGDVEIKRIDVLNLFWEGGISDIQRSPAVFYTQLWDNETLREKYPDAGEFDAAPQDAGRRYLSDEKTDTADKSLVVDWYYKRRRGGRDILHLCKFCRGKLLFASENEEQYRDGFYAHGSYPFFIDKLFTLQGTPCGFGLVDVMRNTQSQIDRLSSAIVKNIELACAVRYFIRTDGAVNEEEFADFTKPFVHVNGSRLGEDSLRQISVRSLDPAAISVLRDKIEELKQVSGNRDFTSGGTSGGITAASAIAALQEAGNKLSRDMIAGTYSVFRCVVLAVIELIRQFYDLPRCFRITGKEGDYKFVSYSASSIARRTVDLFGHTFEGFEPSFDVAVSAEKQSPFARVTQNELAKEFFAMGLFDPSRQREAAMCVSLMDFEGKEALMKKLSESGG
ncbi:MAG: hypothetical protein IJQ80_03615, partial [Clostridia bacterium]|nr:hypothetical protein [Clostridia bacterium]